MTQDWPVKPDYDPTWRSFKGRTDFIPHPSALEGAAELKWRSIYQRPDPVASLPDVAEPIALPLPPVAHPPAAPQAILPREVQAPAPLVPDSVPSVRSPDPTFEPAPSPNHPMADYSAFRVPTPIPTTPVEKLVSLYPQTNAAAMAPASPKRSKRRWTSRPIGIATIVGCIVVAALAFIVVPKMLSSPASLKTMFTAPMLVLRAVGPGTIANVSVTIGQAVEPSTVLLTIHTDPLSDSALDDLKTRLAQAKARQAALDDAPTPTSTARRPKDAAASFQVYDTDHPPPTQRQKDAAAAEVDRLQKAVANAGGSGAADQPILAGVHGIVWSLDAQTGGHLLAGDPLAQLADCGRSFLVVQGNAATLKAGQTVLIRMPGVRPFHGTVRASNGIAEPANTLVVDPTGFSAVAPNACPVGTTAEIQAESRS